MNDLQSLTSYREYKAAFDAEIKASTEGFVKIGFLLRKAMDTTILYDSGYRDVYEFAYNEYRLDRSQVSRFININMRFSQGGYSPNLITSFEGYGPSKLAVMLQLPDGIVEQISADYTREEITEIKEEVKEELENNTPIQAMTEEDAGEVDILTAAVSHYLHEKPEIFAEVYDVLENATPDEWTHRLAEVFAPSGEALLVSRVPGKGKVTIKIREGALITLYSIVLEEKHEFEWENLENACENIVSPDLGQNTVELAWKEAYGEEYPIKAEAKPEKKEDKKPEKKPSRVSIAKPPAKKPEPKVTTCCVAPQNESPVSVADMPEKEERDGSGAEIAPVAPEQLTQINVIIKLEKLIADSLDNDKDTQYGMGYRDGLATAIRFLENE